MQTREESMLGTQLVSCPVAGMCFLCQPHWVQPGSITYFNHVQKHPLQKAMIRASCTSEVLTYMGNTEINILNAHRKMHCLFQSPAMFAFKSNLWEDDIQNQINLRLNLLSENPLWDILHRAEQSSSFFPCSQPTFNYPKVSAQSAWSKLFLNWNSRDAWGECIFVVLFFFPTLKIFI